jgi:hypothetical protein
LTIVNPEIIPVTPLLIEKMEYLSWPQIVSEELPGPMMYVFWLIPGKELCSVISPLTLKNVICPPPWALALKIACLKDPDPESEVVVTTYVPARMFVVVSAVTPIAAQIFLRFDFVICFVLLVLAASASIQPLPLNP